MSIPLDTPGLDQPSVESVGSTLTKQRESTYDDGDHEKFAHYVQKDKIVESAVTGAPVEALCGKKWIPNRDPSRFPVCPDCEAIHSGLPRNKDKK